MKKTNIFWLVVISFLGLAISCNRIVAPVSPWTVELKPTYPQTQQSRSPQFHRLSALRKEVEPGSFL